MKLKEQLINLLETEKLQYIFEHIVKYLNKIKNTDDTELINLMNKTIDSYYELGKLSMIKSNIINLQSIHEDIIDLCLFIEYCEKDSNINTLNELYEQYKLEQKAYWCLRFNENTTELIETTKLNYIIINHNFLYRTMIRCNNKIRIYNSFIAKVMNNTLDKYTDTLKKLLKNLIIECDNHINSEKTKNYLY